MFSKTVRETNTRPSPRPSPTPIRRESQSLWSRSSQIQAAPAAEKTQAPIPANSSPAAAPVSTGGTVPTILLMKHCCHLLPPSGITLTNKHSSSSPSGSGFSRMASIASIFRSHRNGTNQATPATPASNTPSAGGNQCKT